MSKEIQLKYKGNKCSSCGLSVRDILARWGTFNRMTEFHHVDESKKAKNYSSLIRRNICTEQLEELDKCVLLCANCHKLIHAQNIKADINFKLNFEGNEYEQIISGWMILDLLEKKMKFFSDQNFKLNIYQIKIGEGAVKPIVGVEMDAGDFFLKLFRGLLGYKFFEIRNARNSQGLMKARLLKGNEFELKQAVEFPFLNYEWTEEGVSCWARNGKVLDENGKLINYGTITSINEIVPFD